MQNRLTETYVPAEDTFFLAEHITNEKGHTALEIGTGSGYLAMILEKNFELVVATDIDFGVFKSQTGRLWNAVCCDGASALGAKFDLIVCNFPYLPSEMIQDLAVDGGSGGLEVPLKIIGSVSTCLETGGRMMFLTSSLADYEKIADETRAKGFKVKILAKKRLFFEELVILEVTRTVP